MFLIIFILFFIFLIIAYLFITRFVIPKYKSMEKVNEQQLKTKKSDLDTSVQKAENSAKKQIQTNLSLLKKIKEIKK